MPVPREPAAEPDGSIDRALGAVLGAWARDHADGWEVRLLGPLDTAGMDPTWVLSMTGEQLDAEVAVFHGPRVEVAAFRPAEADPDLYVRHEDGPTPARLTVMLDDLLAAGRGAALPGWLVPAPDDRP